MIKIIFLIVLVLVATEQTQKVPSTNTNPKVIIPMPFRPRTIVPPKTVGVNPNCPFPVVKEKITFECICCKLKMTTHVLYPHLPFCPKDGCIMNEVIK